MNRGPIILIAVGAVAVIAASALLLVPPSMLRPSPVVVADMATTDGASEAAPAEPGPREPPPPMPRPLAASAPRPLPPRQPIAAAPPTERPRSTSPYVPAHLGPYQPVLLDARALINGGHEEDGVGLILARAQNAPPVDHDLLLLFIGQIHIGLGQPGRAEALLGKLEATSDPAVQRHLAPLRVQLERFRQAGSVPAPPR